MLSSIFPIFYAAVVIVLLSQALRVMRNGFRPGQLSQAKKPNGLNLKEDRTGRLTIHPELLDQEGRITDEELLTVRFSGDVDPPQSAETSAE